MFKNFFDFGQQRDWKGALFFYAAFFLTLMLISVSLTLAYVMAVKPGLGAAAMTVPEAMESIKLISQKISLCISVSSSALLSVLILLRKRLYNAVGFGLFAAAIVLSFLGGVFGLMPVAVMTMRPRTT